MKEEKETLVTRPECDEVGAKKTFGNFVTMAALFSATQGCMVACLSLATARLGRVGAWQSGVLYLTYTASAVSGATYITKALGSRNSIIVGMVLYWVYIGCFSVATTCPTIEEAAALTGAGIGGIGGGFVWTAQGAYFAQASQRHAAQQARPLSESTTSLAGAFASIYLTFEVVLRSLSTFLSSCMGWRAIFGVYTSIAVVSTILMGQVENYPRDEEATTRKNILHKVTAVTQLLVSDPKMKYMIGLNSIFGFAGAFLNSYINGEVVQKALDDDDSKYVGILTAWLAVVAATMSYVFGKIHEQKGAILIGGTVAFFFVAFPSIVWPDPGQWNWFMLILVYSFQGIGRATFESTLKATFADYFSGEKEGAFANIILQSGLSASIGYVLTFHLVCHEESKYCIEYSDGSLHDVLAFALLVCATSILAIVGYLRASAIHKTEMGSLVDLDLGENIAVT